MIVNSIVFSKEECDEIIKDAEQRGFERIDLEDWRICQRQEVHDRSDLVSKIWSRIRHMCPEENVIGLNPMLRYLKYEKGGHFDCHMDEPYQDKSSISKFTVMIYLNEDYDGGCLEFMDEAEYVIETFVPKTGSVLIFDQELYHRSTKIISGTKYCLRTDVMYKQINKQK